MTTATRLEVLAPTVETIPDDAVIAPRPPTLDGVALGLLANGKKNADVLLGLVNEVLADRYEFKTVVEMNKGNAGRPCPAGIIDDLADQCEVVITASGD